MTTSRYALPLIAPGQAQKELTHNEALALLDMLAQPAVMAIGTETPPAAAAAGACWIVGAAPSGAWAGQAGRLACMTAGGWRFATPQAGFAAWLASADAVIRFDGSVWRREAGAARPAIADPAGGSVTDASARAAITAILEVLRAQSLIL